MRTIEEATKIWARKKFPDIPEDTYNFSIEIDYTEGYQYSEYTMDTERTELLVKFYTPNEAGEREPWNSFQEQRYLANGGEELEEVDFGSIIREIAELMVEDS